MFQSNHNSGFTLMEVMTVVVILSILATFTLSNFSRAVDKAQERDLNGQLILMHSAAAHIQALTGAYWNTASSPVTNLSTINRNLNMQLLSVEDSTFSYTSDGSTYTGVGTSGAVSLQIDEQPLKTTSPNPNPCCTTGNCQIILDC